MRRRLVGGRCDSHPSGGGNPTLCQTIHGSTTSALLPSSPAQALIEVGAPTLFATHFMQLTELAALYPAAKVGDWLITWWEQGSYAHWHSATLCWSSASRHDHALAWNFDMHKLGCILHAAPAHCA